MGYLKVENKGSSRISKERVWMKDSHSVQTIRINDGQKGTSLGNVQ